MTSNPRGLVTRSVEFRATTPEPHGDGRTLDGYAAVFNNPTEINSQHEGHFMESIAPGAFSKTLREKQPIIQFEHGMDARVGSVPIAKLVAASEDKHGLHVEARLFDNPVIEPVRQAIEGGAITGMSFRFEPMRSDWTDARGEAVDARELKPLLYGDHRPADADRLPLHRLIREVRLHEMGPVVNPAYEGTSVGVRSAGDLTDDDRRALTEYYQRSYDERSSGAPLDGDAEDDLNVDHFSSDVPVREDGLPEGYESRESDEDGEDRAKGDAKKPYGEVKYADPGYQSDKMHRYPVDTAEHAKAAWSYINKSSNAEKYSSDDLAKVKSAIMGACKKFGIDVSEPDADDKKSEKKFAAQTSAVRRDTLDKLRADAVRKDTSAPDAVRKDTSVPKNDPEKRKVAPAMTVRSKEELEARRDEILSRLSEIDEEASTRSLPEEQQTEWDALVAEKAEVDDSVKRIEARQEVLKSNYRESGFGGGRSAAFHKEVNPYDYEAIRSESFGDERKHSRLLRDNANRCIERAKFAAAPKNYRGKSQGDVATDLLDEVLGSPDDLAKRMILTGSEVYGRALSKVMAAGNDTVLNVEERTALTRAQSLGTDAGGGFAIPFQLDPTVILTNAGVVNPIRELARQVKITGKQWEGVTSAGTTASRGTEASTVGDNSFTLAQPTLLTYRVAAFVPFSYELELAWQALRSEITNVIVDAKEREEDSFFVGNGTAPNPSGVLSVIGGSTPTVVHTATVATFAAADVYSTYQNLPPRWERNASWVAHKAIYGQIRQFDTAGGAQLWSRIGDGRPPRLLDYPDYASSAMATDATTGNVLMAFGDFSQYLIVDRIGMNVELVPQLFDPGNANRPTGQRGVYAVWMNNGKRLVDTAFNILVAK